MRSLTSQYVFEVEDETGQRVLGSISSFPSEQRIEVKSRAAAANFSQSRVVRMTPIEEGFLGRLDGYVDACFSFVRANRAAQWTLGTEVNSRTLERLVRLSYSSLLSDQEGLERTTRNVLGVQYQHFLSNRWLRCSPRRPRTRNWGSTSGPWSVVAWVAIWSRPTAPI